MNLSKFYNFRPKKDDVLWVLPIRFWEIDEPHRIVILTDCKEDDRHVYCMSDLYGHEVYIDREFLFYDKENAKKAIELLRQLDSLIEDDGVELLMERIFETKKKVLDNVNQT